jgi:hypothetical protein
MACSPFLGWHALVFVGMLFEAIATPHGHEAVAMPPATVLASPVSRESTLPRPGSVQVCLEMNRLTDVRKKSARGWVNNAAP